MFLAILVFTCAVGCSTPANQPKICSVISTSKGLLPAATTPEALARYFQVSTADTEYAITAMISKTYVLPHGTAARVSWPWKPLGSAVQNHHGRLSADDLNKLITYCGD